MPLEKIQNILSSDNGPYTQLYNEAVGKGKGKLSMFLSKHPEITVFGLEGGKKWRVRLTDNKDYEKGDQKEKAAIEAKEKHLLRTLEQYLNEQKDRSCEVDCLFDCIVLLSHQARKQEQGWLDETSVLLVRRWPVSQLILHYLLTKDTACMLQTQRGSVTEAGLLKKRQYHWFLVHTGVVDRRHTAGPTPITRTLSADPISQLGLIAARFQ